MKTFTKTIPAMIAASLLLASVSATAESVVQRTETDIIKTSVVASQAEAFQLGQNKLSQLKATAQNKLSQVLRVNSGRPDLNTLRIEEGAFVTVQQRMEANGKLGYVGMVNVDYSYNQIDD